MIGALLGVCHRLPIAIAEATLQLQARVSVFVGQVELPQLPLEVHILLGV